MLQLEIYNLLTCKLKTVKQGYVPSDFEILFKTELFLNKWGNFQIPKQTLTKCLLEERAVLEKEFGSLSNQDPNSFPFEGIVEQSFQSLIDVLVLIDLDDLMAVTATLVTILAFYIGFMSYCKLLWRFQMLIGSGFIDFFTFWSLYIYCSAQYLCCARYWAGQAGFTGNPLLTSAILWAFTMTLLDQ